jgi:hypothetical protein
MFKGPHSYRIPGIMIDSQGGVWSDFSRTWQVGVARVTVTNQTLGLLQFWVVVVQGFFSRFTHNPKIFRDHLVQVFGKCPLVWFFFLSWGL